MPGFYPRSTLDHSTIDPPPLTSTYRHLTAGFALVLLAVTIRLWLPQTEYPRIPLFAGGLGWPDGVDLLAAGVMVAGLLLTFTPQRWRFGWWVFAVAFGVAVLANQHRLQPWAYQFALLAVVFATTDGHRTRRLARLLVIAVYFHSAHSKLDFAFLHGLGPLLVERLGNAVGLATHWWSEGFRSTLAATLPVAELSIAVGLAVPRTRRFAAWSAVAMHGVLLLVLGPTGGRQAWGVLLWNAYSICQALLLFEPWRTERRPEPTPETGAPRRRAGLAEIVIGFAVLSPLLEPFGCLDHWPAWAVYSERTERVTLFVPSAAREELPTSLRDHVEHGPGFGETIRVRLDRWSLETLGVPPYPQERFRLGVAWAVVRDLPNDVPVRVVIDGLPGRFSGQRERTVLEDREAIERRLASYRLNARPRP